MTGADNSASELISDEIFKKAMNAAIDAATSIFVCSPEMMRAALSAIAPLLVAAERERCATRAASDDFTEKYNTVLQPGVEGAFQEWLAANNRRADLKDYDLRGWFISGEGQAPNGHFTDKFKKPNHPTFSDESIYNGVDGYQGGKWVNDRFIYRLQPPIRK